MHTPPAVTPGLIANATSNIRRRALAVLAAAVPLVWAPFVFAHPAATPFSGSEHEINLWLTVHAAQLVLAPLLAIAVWSLVGGLAGPAAVVAKVALALWLSLFSAFDAIAGIAPAASVSMRASFRRETGTPLSERSPIYLTKTRSSAAGSLCCRSSPSRFG